MRRTFLLAVSACFALAGNPIANASRGVTEHRAPEPGTAGADDAVDPLVQAKVLFDRKDFQGAATLLETELQHSAGDAGAHELLGTVLMQLARGDEAAHYLEGAMREYETAGKSDKAKVLAPLLNRADPMTERRNAFLHKVVDTLYTASEALLKAGHTERALAILGRLPPAAPPGKDAAKVENLLAKIRAQFEEVHLDQGGGAGKTESPEFPLFEYESTEYRFACNLEPDIVKRLGTLMDDLHSFYVQIYFDGNAKKAAAAKPLIRVWPNRKQMLEKWSGGGAGPDAWWSPGENQVTAYDTRTEPGSTLDRMMVDLFHEASHQFMTLLSSGGYTPAWLNEGTASFFEGTVAMADGKVLWPGAAHGRLTNLLTELQNGKPTAHETIAYEGAGSYGPEFYAFGWGLIYFLQQYEDPTSLKYVYRPLYAEYRTKIIKRGGDSLKTFEEVFLGKNSPLGHQTFEDFDRDWQKWIKDTVAPLEGTGAEARKLRLDRANRYMAAAEGTKSKSKGDVSSDELLSRALGDVEYVRSKIDTGDKVDVDLLVMQAGLLEKLKREAAEAPLLEKVLDLADQGKYELAGPRYAEMEKKLAKIDAKNAALRTARSNAAGLARTAAAILAEYRAKGNLPLRSYTFASIAGGALQDDRGLLVKASELREEVKAAGLLHGSIHAIVPERLQKMSTSSSPPNSAKVGPDGLKIDCTRAAEYIDPDVTIAGEYEVRVRLLRTGEPERGSAVGVVIAGNAEDNWTMVGIDEEGRVGVWIATLTGKATDTRGTSLDKKMTFYPKPMIDAAQPIDLTVHVDRDQKVTIKIKGTSDFETTLALDSSASRHVGVFAKNAVVTFKDPVVEIFP